MIVSSASVAARRVRGAPAPRAAKAGLTFPSNTGNAGSTVQFRFTDAALLPAYPATYIWRLKPTQQTGFYTTFFWGPDSTFTGAGYYGCHPYPQGGSGGTTHNWEISAEGVDRITDDNANSTVVTKSQWYTQAAVVRLVNTDEIEVKFYWDLETDAGRVITFTSVGNYATGFPPSSPALTWGDAPWSPGNELLSGTLRGLQIYSSNLSLADIQSEAANDSANTPQTSAGLAAVWYMNQNPTPDDISDKSGEGHDPAWFNSNRPTLWEG
jgi:hypothetical protein